MTLVLHQHPFASYCQKVLVALRDLDLPFEAVLVDGEEGRAAHAELWPLAGIPVLQDTDARLTLPESSAIIEYVDGLPAAGGPTLVPADPAQALQARLWDRIADRYVMDPMSTIVRDRLRPDGGDTIAVAGARNTLETAYGVLETQLAGRPWLAGETFTMADCAAAPALFYCWTVHRWDAAAHPELTRYYAAVMARASVRSVIEDARPYRELLPLPWPDDADAHRS